MTKTCGPIKLEQRNVADLIPYARNSRTHSDEQIAQIAASIREFGFTNPILTDGKDGIIAGHGRLQAARKLGLTQVPCIALDGLSEAQKRAYVDVAVKRWQEFTGEAAVHADGETFDAMKAQRLKLAA